MSNRRPDGTFRCMSCGEAGIFNSITELRQHQWSAHRERFKNLMASAKNRKYRKPGDKKTEAQRAKWREAKALERKLNPKEAVRKFLANGSPPDMSVAELLDTLLDQKKFIDDVIALISSLQSSHTEEQK